MTLSALIQKLFFRLFPRAKNTQHDHGGEIFGKTFLKRYITNVPNANFSLDQPISINELRNNIENPALAEAFAAHKELYFWDLGVTATEFINVGDMLYIATQDYLYCGIIDVRAQDDQGIIGDAIGWARQFRNPWKNPIGFRQMNRYHITPMLKNAISDSINTGTIKASNFYSIQNNLLRDATSSINGDKRGK